jgi:hypothetical protein
MDFDSAPSSVTVTHAFLTDTLALFAAVDDNGEQWSIVLNMGRFGMTAKRLFAETIQSRVEKDGSYVLTTSYDDAKDEWFAIAGNYGIYSKDLRWTEITGE